MGIISRKPATDTEYDASKGVVYEKTKQSSYMTDKDLAELPLLQRINWLSFWIIFGPLLGFLIGFPFVALNWKTLLLAWIQYWLTGLGITAGYHRLWSHKAYRANAVVETVLALWGAAAFEGSVRWWCRSHRAHHRYVDTEKDPYTVHKGFWHAHLGWMVFKQDQRKAGRVDISDLNAIPLLQFQHRYYLSIALTFGFVLPLAIAHFGWNDFWGALVYAGCLRMVFVHQATFCINSLAHALGEQSFSTEHTSYDSWVTALVTFGEGYHNFHHEFPHDYRNGIKWYNYDPTKWLIWGCSALGACWGLEWIPDNEIEKARVQVQEKQLEQRKQKVDWGVPATNLPSMTWKDVEEEQQKGKMVVVLDGFVHDLSEFMGRHPGGTGIIKFWKGRDATLAFNGEIYKHSKAARNLVPHFRMGKLVEQLE